MCLSNGFDSLDDKSNFVLVNWENISPFAFVSLQAECLPDILHKWNTMQWQVNFNPITLVQFKSGK